MTSAIHNPNYTTTNLSRNRSSTVHTKLPDFYEKKTPTRHHRITKKHEILPTLKSHPQFNQLAKHEIRERAARVTRSWQRLLQSYKSFCSFSLVIKLFYNAPLHLAQFLPKANEVLALRRIGFTLGLEKEG